MEGRGRTRLKEEAQREGAKGKHTNPLVLYIEILVYTAFLSLRRNLFDGTGGLAVRNAGAGRAHGSPGRGRSGAGPGWLARGWGRPKSGGEQRRGWGAPRALDWGTKVLVTLLLLYFLSCVWGSIRHSRGGEAVSRLSPPAPLGPRARRPLRQHGGENKALGRPASAGRECKAVDGRGGAGRGRAAGGRGPGPIGLAGSCPGAASLGGSGSRDRRRDV